MTEDVLCEYAHRVHAYQVADEATNKLVFFCFVLFLPLFLQQIHSLILNTISILKHSFETQYSTG